MHREEQGATNARSLCTQHIRHQCSTCAQVGLWPPLMLPWHSRCPPASMMVAHQARLLGRYVVTLRSCLRLVHPASQSRMTMLGWWCCPPKAVALCAYSDATTRMHRLTTGPSNTLLWYQAHNGATCAVLGPTAKAGAAGSASDTTASPAWAAALRLQVRRAMAQLQGVLRTMGDTTVRCAQECPQQQQQPSS